MTGQSFPIWMGNRRSMMVPMEVAPVSLKEALDFVEA